VTNVPHGYFDGGHVPQSTIKVRTLALVRLPARGLMRIERCYKDFAGCESSLKWIRSSKTFMRAQGLGVLYTELPVATGWASHFTRSFETERNR
jgi:hypothetical protein